MNKNDVLFSKLFLKDLSTTSSDALPLNYRKLVGVKAIKLGLSDKHPACC